jgi:acyl-coenzyme A synthetase/AMP-(fatty) acid ligase
MSDGRRRLVDAVLTAGGKVNGIALDARDSGVAQFAGRLQRSGVGDGDLVLLAHLPPDAVLFAAVACWSLGAAPWISPRALDGAPPDEPSFIVRRNVEVERCEGTAGPAPESLAVVHETSGSTGEPKPARRSVDSIHAEQVGYRDGLSLREHDRVRVPLPVAHSLGWGVALSSLLSGCDVDVRPFSTPSSVAADLDHGHADTVALTPALARLLVATRRRGERSPRAVLVGAGHVSAELEAEFSRRFGAPITRGYGATETGGIFIGPVGIGRPIPAVEIVSPAIGSRGELVVATSTPVLGYLQEDVRRSTRWNMRDVVERDASGQVWFIERAPGAVRANGRFVDTGGVQAALGELEGVDEVTVVVLPRAGQPEFDDVFAVVGGRQVNREAVDRVVRAAASRGLVPRARIYDRLPRTELGKLDREALADWIRRDG